ncbi:hypothetical protein L6164_031318 [Bauhinia variegata]|uniref:Uncharacterized protein n=1 Tax=Bauhinia variegata TaxID=167791 RepID=A0ACB9LF96_BAUVA|nr:hypothetical protein L6164_031318 [Bauhinia variegata]
MLDFSSTSSSSRSIVKNLPGFGDLPFNLETGYIGVGDREEIQLFFYFVESQRSPTTDPLLLWLVGGPGCTALSAFFFENGPLVFNYANITGNLPELQLNPNTWTKVVNIIYVDSPVGTGFSYSTTQQGYHTSDSKTIENLYEFLQKWVVDHPEFGSNPLYIGGGSYTGKYVPPVVQKVYQGSKAGITPLVNIQGYLLASPSTDKILDSNSRVEFAYRLSLIPDKLYKSIKSSCNGEFGNINPDNKKCASDYEAFSELVYYLNEYNIYEAACLEAYENQIILFEDSQITQESTVRCRMFFHALSEPWANDHSVRKALHVREGTKGQFVRCNRTDLAYTLDITSAIQYHQNFTNTNLRSLIFCGDVDLAMPHLGTQSWIQSLNNLEVKNTWRAWFVDRQVAGYTETYGNNEFLITYATVKASTIYLE